MSSRSILSQEDIEKFLSACESHLFLETSDGNFVWCSEQGNIDFAKYSGTLSKYVDEKGLSYKSSFTPKPGMLMHTLASL